jgi:hypothetical protein
MEDSAVIYRSTFRPAHGTAPVVVDVAGGRKEVVEASVRATDTAQALLLLELLAVVRLRTKANVQSEREITVV